jgi:hypothetical protein
MEEVCSVLGIHLLLSAELRQLIRDDMHLDTQKVLIVKVVASIRGLVELLEAHKAH